ncbi:hypothetical protein U9M48_019586 [Paspalum notatum var. saurae]|uniref:Uncharacterized protein n=1 Tax=Paspalum notatum var. saurae TaxID=547442 RepID=A0AAQ3TF91_PASNO
MTLLLHSLERGIPCSSGALKQLFNKPSFLLLGQPRKQCELGFDRAEPVICCEWLRARGEDRRTQPLEVLVGDAAGLVFPWPLLPLSLAFFPHEADQLALLHDQGGQFRRRWCIVWLLARAYFPSSNHQPPYTLEFASNGTFSSSYSSISMGSEDSSSKGAGCCGGSYSARCYYSCATWAPNSSTRVRVSMYLSK